MRILTHLKRLEAESIHILREVMAESEDAEAQGINPFNTGSALYSQAQLTDPLKRALTAHGFDAAFGGGRHDVEKARAKGRIFSFRSAAHRWNPKQQRPELWTYTTRRNPRARALASSRFRTGPNSISGNILHSRTSISSPLLFERAPYGRARRDYPGGR